MRIRLEMELPNSAFELMTMNVKVGTFGLPNGDRIKRGNLKGNFWVDNLYFVPSRIGNGAPFHLYFIFKASLESILTKIMRP